MRFDQLGNSLLQPINTLFSPALRFDQLGNSLLQPAEALLHPLLRLGQVAHQLRQRQQLLAQYQTAELGAPIGLLLKEFDKIMEIPHRKSHLVFPQGGVTASDRRIKSTR